MVKALILAGGKGARLRPLALHVPKPIVPLANIPFLFYQIDRVKRAAITEVVLSLSYQPRKIIDIFGDGMPFGVTMRYTHEDLPLGTAGAFKAAENLIDDTMIVLNGDVLTDIDLTDLLRFHREKGAEATLATVRVMNPSGYGLVEARADGRVARFTEKPPEDDVTGDTINAGIYVLERSVLARIPAGSAQSFERDLFPLMAQEGAAIYAYHTQGFWQDIGSPAKYLDASFGVISGRVKLPRYPHNSCLQNDWEKARITIDDISMLDGKCVVKPGVSIENSVLGEGCRIEEGARIKDSVIWSGTRVLPSARIERSIVGRQCYIGEGARLRPGTVLGDKSSVSDFSVI
ncbi:MAG: NDP-sugar synthase [Acidobacteriota bacterium]|jgi:NDP-sugar pyrophosphorylase family protein|nr:NDP-sugar synthase [Acidobacteriota bacterium]